MCLCGQGSHFKTVRLARLLKSSFNQFRLATLNQCSGFVTLSRSIFVRLQIDILSSQGCYIGKIISVLEALHIIVNNILFAFGLPRKPYCFFFPFISPQIIPIFSLKGYTRDTLPTLTCISKYLLCIHHCQRLQRLTLVHLQRVLWMRGNVYIIR